MSFSLVHPTRIGQLIVGAVAHCHSEPWDLSAIHRQVLLIFLLQDKKI